MAGVDRASAFASVEAADMADTTAAVTAGDVGKTKKPAAMVRGLQNF